MHCRGIKCKWQAGTSPLSLENWAVAVFAPAGVGRGTEARRAGMVSRHMPFPFPFQSNAGTQSSAKAVGSRAKTRRKISAKAGSFATARAALSGDREVLQCLKRVKRAESAFSLDARCVKRTATKARMLVYSVATQALCCTACVLSLPEAALKTLKTRSCTRHDSRVFVCSAFTEMIHSTPLHSNHNSEGEGDQDNATAVAVQMLQEYG
jgi:hypothetical protein